MVDWVGYIFVGLTLFVFGYALVWQIRDTKEIKQSTKWQTAAGKRKLIGSYLQAVSLAGFFVSYLLNVAIGTLAFMKADFVQPALINSNSTAFACFLFLALYFISRFAIMPKKEKDVPLLKAKI